MSESGIYFFNRYSRKLEEEKVAGDASLKWTYGTALGRFVLWAAVKRTLLSRVFGWLADLPVSRNRIEGFVEQYDIAMSEYEEPEEGYACFNDFFVRKLHEGVRPIYGLKEYIVFPADARHMLFENIDRTDSFYIKGQKVDLESLLASKEAAERYKGGALLVSRLCPVDYHRFHFPADGMPSEARVIPGDLYSVNPFALKRVPGVFWNNARAITEVDSGACGIVTIIEVGATFVGSIKQTFDPGVKVSKGDEKGCFAFGGSTLLTLFEPGAVSFAEDLVEQSAAGIELYARMGDRLGRVNG